MAPGPRNLGQKYVNLPLLRRYPQETQIQNFPILFNLNYKTSRIFSGFDQLSGSTDRQVTAGQSQALQWLCCSYSVQRNTCHKPFISNLWLHRPPVKSWVLEMIIIPKQLVRKYLGHGFCLTTIWCRVLYCLKPWCNAAIRH